MTMMQMATDRELLGIETELLGGDQVPERRGRRPDDGR